MFKIYFSKVKEGAKIPQKRTEDAGYDIYACFDEDYMVLKPHETKLIPTGIASAFSEDYYFQIFDRGGTGAKGITCFAGVIDSGFRGEWFIAWHNANKTPVIIHKKHVDTNNIDLLYVENTIYYPYEKAIAQAILLPVPKTEIEEVDYDVLKSFNSERGEQMLGSTDVISPSKEKEEQVTKRADFLTDNPFCIHQEKIIEDLTRIEESLKHNKFIKNVTVSFTDELDLADFGSLMENLIKTSDGIEMEAPIKKDEEYPIIGVDLKEKTISFLGEKLCGLFPCNFTLKYNPEIMHLNFCQKGEE